MIIDNSWLFSSAAYLLMFLGVVGALIPVLPGPILILAGAIVYSLGVGAGKPGIPVLIVLSLMTAAAWGSELVLTMLFTRKAGASWRTVAGAVAGGLVGGIVLTPALPVIGTLFGAAAGAALGVVFVERVLNARPWDAAWRVSRNYLAGCLVARVVELGLCLGMITVFVIFSK